METARGAEVPFEVIEERRGRVPLYCYRPLTSSLHPRAARRDLGTAHVRARGSSADRTRGDPELSPPARRGTDPRRGPRARRGDAAVVPGRHLRRAQRVRVRPGAIRGGVRRARDGPVRGPVRDDRDRAPPGPGARPRIRRGSPGRGALARPRGDASRRSRRRGLGRRRRSERARGAHRQPGALGPPGGVARARPLPPTAHRAAAVRARRLRARAGRVDAHRQRPVAARCARLERPGPARDPAAGRQRGRAPRRSAT